MTKTELRALDTQLRLAPLQVDVHLLMGAKLRSLGYVRADGVAIGEGHYAHPWVGKVHNTSLGGVVSEEGNGALEVSVSVPNSVTNVSCRMRNYGRTWELDLDV